jgi:hypothetical protein
MGDRMMVIALDHPEQTTETASATVSATVNVIVRFKRGVIATALITTTAITDRTTTPSEET